MKSSTAKKTTKVLSKSDALRCVPFHNEIAQWYTTDDDVVLVEYPLPIKPFFKSILQRFSNKPIPDATKKLELDEMGSLVWQMIDGKQNTKTIVKLFAKHYSITLQEAELSVTTFLLELGKRGLIGMSEQTSNSTS